MPNGCCSRLAWAGFLKSPPATHNPCHMMLTQHTSYTSAPTPASKGERHRFIMSHPSRRPGCRVTVHLPIHSRGSESQSTSQSLIHPSSAALLQQTAFQGLQCTKIHGKGCQLCTANLEKQFFAAMQHVFSTGCMYAFIVSKPAEICHVCC